ncbi:hypothetical protein N665_1758s0004 [Sinapis alba]|nr:hypothetical protein N665_1758s0004 [Sinapis alba]
MPSGWHQSVRLPAPAVWSPRIIAERSPPVGALARSTRLVSDEMPSGLPRSSAKVRSKPGSTTARADSAEKLDELLISSAVCNGEDLGPFVRKIFATGKPETLLHYLKLFARSKELEIEEVCKAHYQDFINAVDDLKPLLSSLDSLVEAQTLVSRANQHLQSGSFYMALKCVDSIENDLLEKMQPSTLKRMLEKRIPEIRGYVERKVSKELRDWLVEIRVVSWNLGQLVIDDDDEYESGFEGSDSFNFTLLYRAYHIHQTLSLEDGFKRYYFDNRELQLKSDSRVSSMTPFLESHQTFFAQIAGFFLVEDRVLRTEGGLISKQEVEFLWDLVVGNMCAMLEDQFSRMQTANHLLLIRDYVSLLGVSLCRYGYIVDSLLEVLSKHRDKYHELLLFDCRKQMIKALSADKFEQMLMKKEYEYSMNVLSFKLQTLDIAPAFPYIAPLSTTVSFMSHGGQLDFYDVVKKYLDRLLGGVLDEALLKLINTPVHGVSQTMQVATNMAVFERACDFFFRHAAQLSGVPLRMVKRGRRHFPLTKSQNTAEDTLSELLKKKIETGGNKYMNEVITYLETSVSTAQQILPAKVLKRVLRDVLAHISKRIVGTLCGDVVKRLSIAEIKGVDVDIQLLESFTEQLKPMLTDKEAKEIKTTFVKIRQMVNLLFSNHPENFVNPVIREKSYNALDYMKVTTVSEKLRDPSDSIFGTFGVRGSRQNPKNKSLDTLIKRLKDVS